MSSEQQRRNWEAIMDNQSLMDNSPVTGPDVKYLQFFTTPQNKPDSEADELYDKYFTVNKDIVLGNNDNLNRRSLYRHWRVAKLKMRAGWDKSSNLTQMNIQFINALERSKDGFTAKEINSSHRTVIASAPTSPQQSGFKGLLSRLKGSP